MRLGRLKNLWKRFEVVEKFKYLGVYLYSNNIIKKAKERCRDAITSTLNFKIFWINNGLCRIGLYLWYLSKIIYQLVSKVVLNVIDASYIEKYCLRTLRKITFTAPYVNTQLLKEFYATDIAIRFTGCQIKLVKYRTR